jgi:hypothetical protein
MKSTLVYAILLAFIFSTAQAVEKTINWSASKRYPKMNTRVGDTVKFVYEAGAHNVVMPATKKGYRVGSTNHKRKPHLLSPLAQSSHTLLLFPILPPSFPIKQEMHWRHRSW